MIIQHQQFSYARCCRMQFALALSLFVLHLAGSCWAHFSGRIWNGPTSNQLMLFQRQPPSLQYFPPGRDPNSATPTDFEKPIDAALPLKKVHDQRKRDLTQRPHESVAATSGSDSAVPDSDANILMEFKKGIGQDPTGALQTWNSSLGSFCRWRGIICDRSSRHVLSLNLSAMNLSGTITPRLGGLVFLSILDLSSNSLDGTIPPSLSKIQDLNFLILSDNNLLGSIPTDLSNCSSLQLLDLSSNHLEGPIPPEFGALSQLKYLHLNSNQLSGTIPPSFGNCSSLVDLDLSNNGLNGSLPSEFAALTHLQRLYLGTNALTGVIPIFVTNLSSINYLSLNDNHLSGTIPPQMSQLTHLKILRLGYNDLVGCIPASLANCSNLAYLGAISNRLNCHIPSELGQMRSLGYLCLASNSLSGTIPKELGQLSLLYGLRLEHNFLTGNIPATLANCSSLGYLSLGENRLYGTLPQELGHLSLLEYLHLQTNLLTGIISATLANCSLLRELQVDQNKLNGTLPNELGDLKYLNRAFFGGNILEGSIPTSLWKLKKLQQLHLQDNFLIGNLPSDIGNCTQLGELLIANNNLDGSIPSSLGQLQELTSLHLQNNNLSGYIPSSLVNCQRLNEIILDHNKLTGILPMEITKITSLITLNLSSNLLRGPLPSQFESLINIVSLDLSSNQFSNSIPVSLKQCHRLEKINFSHNSLIGEIPIMNALQSLEVLDLSFNNLTGSIPLFLANLPMLAYLNLSENALSGQIPKGGAFASNTATSFLGNPKFCGAIVNRTCPSLHHKRLGVVIKISIACGSLVGVLFMGMCLIQWSKRWQSSATSTCLSNDERYRGFLKITAHELQRATNNFSESNKLGEGGFSFVYKAILGDGTIVAAKLFEFESCVVEESFFKECQILGKVRHKNIIKVVSAISNLDMKAIILQFVSNGNLKEHLYKPNNPANRLTWETRLAVAINVAEAICYLHYGGHEPILHLDLKPSNILLDENKEAYVTDFGIARLMNTSASGAEITTTIRGSWGYIAPEYTDSGQISVKGDVYSYGIVLLELLTKRRPTDSIFDDATNISIWVQHSLSYKQHILKVVDDALINDRGDLVSQGICDALKIGVICSRISVEDRPTMRHVVRMLQQVKDKYVLGQ